MDPSAPTGPPSSRLPLAGLLAALAVGGLVSGPLNPLLVTVRHERIPPALRGRVFGAFSAVAVVAQPLGMLGGGLLVEAAGVRPATLTLAALSQALGVVLFFVPILRDMDGPGRPPAIGTPASPSPSGFGATG